LAAFEKTNPFGVGLQRNRILPNEPELVGGARKNEPICSGELDFAERTRRSAGLICCDLDQKLKTSQVCSGSRLHSSRRDPQSSRESLIRLLQVIESID
jgi:hypothetical protein